MHHVTFLVAILVIGFALGMEHPMLRPTTPETEPSLHDQQEVEQDHERSSETKQKLLPSGEQHQTRNPINSDDEVPIGAISQSNQLNVEANEWFPALNPQAAPIEAAASASTLPAAGHQLAKDYANQWSTDPAGVPEIDEGLVASGTWPHDPNLQTNQMYASFSHETPLSPGKRSFSQMSDTQTQQVTQGRNREQERTAQIQYLQAKKQQLEQQIQQHQQEYQQEYQHVQRQQSPPQQQYHQQQTGQYAQNEHYLQLQQQAGYNTAVAYTHGLVGMIPGYYWQPFSYFPVGVGTTPDAWQHQTANQQRMEQQREQQRLRAQEQVQQNIEDRQKYEKEFPALGSKGD